MNWFWYFAVLKKYADFNGRARRQEYWMFFLFNLIIVIGLIIIGRTLDGSRFPARLYRLAVLVPSIAVGVRRMHDPDHCGWYLLIPIYNLILAARPGQMGDNRFGRDPKAATTPTNLP